MINRYLTFYTPSMQFVVFCAILSMSWLVGGSLIELLNTKITGLTTAQITNLTDISVAVANQFKLINSLLLVVTLLLPAVLFAYLAYPEPMKYLGLRVDIKKQHWLWAIALMIISMPFTSLLEQWSRLIPAIGQSKALDDNYNKLAQSMLQGSSPIDLVMNIGAMCLLPAFIEEIFFRGCLQQLLLNWMKKTPFVAILVVAVIFSAFHGQLSGFVPRVFLGLLLGVAYHYSGSIWLTMCMHALNNFVTVLMVYLFNAHIIKIDMTKLPDTNLWLGLGSALAVGGVLYLFYTNRKPFLLVEVDKTIEKPLP